MLQLALAIGLVLSLPVLPAVAAEVLQVRSATLLQVGDQNRTYTISLACLDLSPEQSMAATDWLRRDLPRRTRVNFKPQGSSNGQLLAQVVRLDRGSDVASDLAAAGFGQLEPGCSASA
ncbi:MAG: hypothetical protein FJ077_00445 [Cyanobacteria bacterium K_DeepCast_35m_m2_023]|nr:hypothetical protein [Cyanobacteria bacterium K_DeepCast_35m_m2_023]